MGRLSAASFRELARSYYVSAHKLATQYSEMSLERVINQNIANGDAALLASLETTISEDGIRSMSRPINLFDAHCGRMTKEDSEIMFRFHRRTRGKRYDRWDHYLASLNL